MGFTEAYELENKYWKKMNKRLKTVPKHMQIIQRRTVGTAIGILDNLFDIPFEKLSMSLYFYCQDLQMIELTRLYESQIELAGANTDRFVMGLHKFYNEMARKIKNEDLYADFFELYYRCNMLRVENDNKNIDDKVVLAYICLLIQQTEYLKPDKFDYNVYIAGRKTTGELILAKDLYPDIDLPSYELHELIDSRRNKVTAVDVKKIYAKYGYKINDITDFDVITNMCRAHSTVAATMLPFINEYTYDMISTVPFNTSYINYMSLLTLISHIDLEEKLTRRKKPLPTNGVIIQFEENAVFDKLLMKEAYYDESIILLFKASTVDGDICGFYNTKQKFIYHHLREYKQNPEIGNNLSSLFLFCYACYVLDRPELTLSKMPDYFILRQSGPLRAKGFLQGGKPRVFYNEDASKQPRGPRKGNEKYRSEYRSFHEMIRKLPEGQKASQEAIDFAEKLGYELEPDQTIVRPFTRQVYKLKRI